MDLLDIKKLKKAEIIGIIVASLLAPLFHFTYEWSGSSQAVGLFSAVNESVWEHSKIIVFPFLFYAIAEFSILRPNAKRFWASKAVGMAFLPVAMIMFFYTYSGMFGVEILIVDIISTVVWLFFGFIISYSLFKTGFQLEKYFEWFAFLLIAVIAMELLFTFFPPAIPLFRDSVTGSYGFGMAP